MNTELIIHDLGLIDYQTSLNNMRDFTEKRTAKTPDEIWLLEHPPVFTQGLAGKAEHVLDPHHIPVIQTDRGGQVTYHGPGQLVVYVLIDLKRKKLYARDLVRRLEKSVIDLLEHYHIKARSDCKAPGVYVDQAKICSIGLRVRKGASFHGIALNVDMDLTPFTYINPCGYQDMRMTQIKAFDSSVAIHTVKKQITACIKNNFGYNQNAKSY